MPLIKRDIVLRISQQTGLSQTEALAIVQRVLDHIRATLARGGRVELRNFGVFDVVVRRARTGRNPNQPTVHVPIPARASVKFKAGKIMKARVLAANRRKFGGGR